jgi:hypothetical protein
VRTSLRILVRIAVGAGAAWVAVGTRQAWELAKQNSASPGAIVLLGISWTAAFIAVVSAVSIVALLVRNGDAAS